MTYLHYIVRRILFGTRKADLVVYPLFAKPADLKLHADSVRQPAVVRLMSKMANGDYQRHGSRCLCGNVDGALDQVISRLEMHGIPLDVLLCWKCGLIRSADVFDDRSNAGYYRHEYREILHGGNHDIETVFLAQMDRGSSFLRILGDIGLLPEIKSVAEIGSGSGGVLYPFHSIGKIVTGYDYDDDHLEYGRSKGMFMTCIGQNTGPIPRDAPDLLILSHVVEHFVNPRKELMRYIERVKPGKFLLIEVPGIFCTSTKRDLHGYPVRYFQLAHVIQFFYREYLEVFYKAFGLEIIHGDETATFVLRKPVNWQPRIPCDIFSPELSRYPALIDAYLKEAFFDYRHRPDKENVIFFCTSMLERIGLRKAIKKLVHR